MCISETSLPLSLVLLLSRKGRGRRYPVSGHQGLTGTRSPGRWRRGVSSGGWELRHDVVVQRVSLLRWGRGHGFPLRTPPAGRVTSVARVGTTWVGSSLTYGVYARHGPRPMVRDPRPTVHVRHDPRPTVHCPLSTHNTTHDPRPTTHGPRPTTRFTGGMCWPDLRAAGADEGPGKEPV